MRCSSVKSSRPLPTSLAHARTVSITETHRSGNYINAFSVPVVTYSKSQYQAEGRHRRRGGRRGCLPREAGKPIVIEKVDFRRKKAALDVQSLRYSRMLSSFSYSKIKAYFISRGHREGVEVHQVNPAFSSVIGRVKFTERYGLSLHRGHPLGAGPEFAQLFRTHPLLPGVPRWQWRLGRPRRTYEETSEAPVDSLGHDLGSDETGDCRATLAG